VILFHCTTANTVFFIDIVIAKFGIIARQWVRVARYVRTLSVSTGEEASSAEAISCFSCHLCRIDRNIRRCAMQVVGGRLE